MSTDVLLLESVSPGRDLDAYIQTINAIPILTPERERELAERLFDDNDLEAARELVLCHLRFVVHLAKGYRGYGLPIGDLIQEGNVGLMKAVKRFDPSFGVRLVSFAVHWIKAEIHEFVLRNWRVVKVATTKGQRKLFFNLRNRKKSLSWLTAEETRAIAEDLGVDAKVVTQMEGRLAARDVGFDGDDTDDGDSNNNFGAPSHFLTDEGQDPADLVAAEDWAQQSQVKLRDAMDQLDDRSRDILQNRWLEEDKTTLQELAKQYGVSAERIRQLEQNAIKKLKTHIEAA
ncbi:MAG: RNA polymerase sigma factor RpoH [Pseudomonadota bacterium]|nr:RNA polymerase sigma factor RpoH [Pseudomonadota bacterium]